VTGLGATIGCGPFIGATTYSLSPRHLQPPEYEFPADSRIALFIETAHPGDENPVFNEALQERLVQILREKKSKGTILPLRAVADLRRADPALERWSLQRIGRELGADHVLYLRLDRLVIRETPDHPLLSPSVDLRMKLIGVNQPAAHARLWPKEKEGRTISYSRQSRDAADANPDAPDIEAAKLGRDTAYRVAMPFITVDLEEQPPVEP
jgi:hypothetical protein